MMSCDCIKKVDAMLAEKNTRLSPTIVFSKPSYMVVALKTETILRKRGARPVAMLPTYCPFCGQRYVEETEAA